MNNSTSIQGIVLSDVSNILTISVSILSLIFGLIGAISVVISICQLNQTTNERIKKKVKREIEKQYSSTRDKLMEDILNILPEKLHTEREIGSILRPFVVHDKITLKEK